MAGKRKYWPRLKILIDLLCRFYNRYKDKLPSDLPPAVTALLLLVDAACLAMDIYDQEHKGGGPA